MSSGVRIALLAAAVILLDQLTKVGYDGPLHYSTAFAGDSPSDTRSWAHVLSATVLTGLVCLFARKPWWAAGLAIGGLLSLLADRIILGGVRNPIATGSLHWNLADLAALAGIVVCSVFAIKTRGGGDVRCDTA